MKFGKLRERMAVRAPVEKANFLVSLSVINFIYLKGVINSSPICTLENSPMRNDIQKPLSFLQRPPLFPLSKKIGYRYLIS